MNVDELIYEYYEKVIEGDEIEWANAPGEMGWSKHKKYYYVGDDLYIIKDETIDRILFIRARSLQEAEDIMVKKLKGNISKIFKAFEEDL